MTNFYKNYVSLCAQKKKSASAVAVEVGLSRTSPNGWKKGKNPSDINLKKIADYFGVTVEYLLTDHLEQKENPATASSEVSEKDIRLINWFRSLPEEKQRAILVSQDAPKDVL